MSRISIVALVVGLAAAVPAAAQNPHAGHGAMPAAAGETASTRDYKAADQAMMKSMMAAPYTGDAAVDFRLHMIPHHEGAIAMARVALKYDPDPETKALAETIIADQTREIGEMKAWLKHRGH